MSKERKITLVVAMVIGLIVGLVLELNGNSEVVLQLIELLKELVPIIR